MMHVHSSDQFVSQVLFFMSVSVLLAFPRSFSYAEWGIDFIVIMFNKQVQMHHTIIFIDHEIRCAHIIKKLDKKFQNFRFLPMAGSYYVMEYAHVRVENRSCSTLAEKLSAGNDRQK